MRLNEIEIHWVLLGFAAVSIVILLIFNKNTDDPLLDKLNRFKLSMALGGFFLFLMYLLMPRMSAFKYPYDVEDVNSPEKILKYLQHQNDAIDRLADLTGLTFFFIAILVMSTGFNFLHALGNHLKKEKATHNNENIS